MAEPQLVSGALRDAETITRELVRQVERLERFTDYLVMNTSGPGGGRDAPTP